MGYEIEIIRLAKRALVKEKTEQIPKNLETKTKEYVLMDDFDVLTVQSIGNQEKIENFPEKSEQKDLSPRSLVLYRREEDEKNKTYLGNPFVIFEEQPYLAIIQVYIAPEAFAYFDTDKMREQDKPERADGAFIRKRIKQDLLDVLDGVFEMDKTQKWTANIYQTLSAGDISLVVRSEMPQAAFMISSTIRRRYAKADSEEYILYKTYSLLAIDPEIHKVNAIAQNEMLIKGRYSYTYWKSENAKLRQIELKDYTHLRGKYDFVMKLSESEFYAVLPELAKHKQLGIEDTRTEENLSEKILYLKQCLEKGCFSDLCLYYAIEEQDKKEIKCSESRRILLKKIPNMEELFEKNESIIRKLEEEADKICKNTFVKSYPIILENMQIFQRLICICRELNELSETRIYAYTLEDDMMISFKQLKEYLNYYIQNLRGNSDTDILEGYLQKTVTSLEYMARMVQKNTLQIFQLPTDVIISHIGMEKNLLCYGELIRLMLQNYQTFYKNGNLVRKDSRYTSEKYIPLVMDNGEESSIEILFDKGLDWTSEKNNTTEEKKYLMVVTCLNAQEADKCLNVVVELYHEMAHHMLYGSREDRNKTVFFMVLEEFMEAVSVEAADYLGLSCTNTEAVTLLRDSFCEAYFEKFYIDDFKTVLDGPLEVLESHMNIVFWTWLQQEKKEKKNFLENALSNFLKHIMYSTVPKQRDYETVERLNILKSELHRLEGKLLKNEVIEDDKDDIEEKVRQLAFSVAVEWTQKYLPEKESSPLENWNIKNMEYRQIWKEIFGGGREAVYQRKIDRNWDAFAELCVSLEYYIGLYTNDFEGLQITGSFYSSRVFEMAKQKWEITEKENRQSIQNEKKLQEGCVDYREWLLFGRKLGFLDTDPEVFWSVMENVRERVDWERSKQLSVYRETVSDLFMYQMLQLSPLSYLRIFVENFLKGEFIYNIEDIQRFFWVLFIAQCYPERDPDDESHMKEDMECAIESFHTIWILLYKSLGSMWMHCLKVSEDEKRCMSAIRWNSPKDREFLQRKIECVRKKLRECCEKDGFYYRLDGMYQILDELAFMVDLETQRFERNPYLLRDLRRGKKRFQEFMEWVKECDTDEKRSIWEFNRVFCECIKNTQKEKDIQANWECMEKMQDLYFLHKRRTACEMNTRGCGE